MGIPTESAGERFQKLVDIMAKLRGPGGCPWDREQSFDTIKRYLLEETYEVMDAIDARDWPGLADALGDLLLQPVILAQMAAEEQEGEIGDLLFVVVNLARFLKVDPEQALRKTNAKFRKRFAHVERRLAEQGRTPQQSTVPEMEAFWQEAKQS